jgi:choline/ethanolamine kinase
MNCVAFQNEITMIKTFLKSWEELSPDSIKFERLGGLSNIIWKVTAADQAISPDSILFRKFGDNEELVCREKESYIFTELSKRGIGPGCYGGDRDIRLEEFYESRTLSPSDVNDTTIRRNLSKALSNLHKASLDELEKTPMFLQVLEHGSLMKNAETKAKKDIYSHEEKKWLEEIMALTGEEEVSFLKNILPKGKESVVFSHNDIHSQNILLLNRTEKLVLIDYEYGSYNYRGYDIANFFNEATIDYTSPEYPYYTLDQNKYPSHSDLMDFIKYYVFFSKFEGKGVDEERAMNDDEYFTQVINEHCNIDEFNAEVEEIYEEVRVCAMLSHYYWILWAIVMSKNPNTSFDYLHYAHKRLEAYQNLKREYTSSKDSNVEIILANN